MFASLLIAACQPVGEPEEGFTPTPWVYEEEALAPLPLSLPELEAAVDEVLATVLRADPLLPLDAFSQARMRSDGDCPAVSDHSNQDLVSGDCTTEGGYTFLGYALYHRIGNLWVDYEGVRAWHARFDWCTGHLRVLGPDGSLLELLGDDLYREYLDENGDTVLDMYLWGDFYQEVPGLDSWLTDNIGVQLYFDGTRRADGNVGTWDGALSRLQGIAKAGVLHDLAIDSTPGACVSEGVGAIDVLAENGVWHTVEFDGVADCDGCGVASSEGEVLGEVCVDMTALADWEMRPWRR